jgi:signal transduction histidine kinase/CheY-like chemotaxis protein
MAGVDPNRTSLGTAEGLLSQAERSRITSGFRLATALLAMVTLIVAGLTGLIFLLVSSVFDSMTPSVTRDLEWKALRGAVELSKTAELGLVVRDAELVRKAAEAYLVNSDVVGVLALTADDELVFEHGAETKSLRHAFSGPANKVQHSGDQLLVWAPAIIEGQMVGRVLVAVSTARLLAGDELRAKISLAAMGGGAVALLLAIGFVVLYILPILRLTQSAFRRLEHTTEMALEGARMKAQFLANMSHEIRTPMNAVVGLAKLMLGMPLGPKVRRYAERIDASARSLLNIINDILDFSKLEAGKYQIHTAPCEPALVVQEVAELLAEKAQSKGVDLVYRVAPEVPRQIEADVDRLRQVLTNLVGNAVKFTEVGEVYVQLSLVSAADDQVRVRYEVTDSGIGVPEELREHIFESFSQADGSLVRRHGGTGLGLAISKQLVILMGGTIGLTSELGKGSTFWFEVPAKVVDKSSAVRAQPSSLGKRALVLCDNEHAATALREHVTAWGMNAVVASGEQDAVAQLRSAVANHQIFDILLISETQSGTHAAPLIAALRTQLAGDLPSVVVLSQLRTDSTRSELADEIAAQLAQPVRMSELYECLARVLSPGSVRPLQTQARPAIQNFQGARVLVVDDNEMNQFVASEQLLRFGCKVDQAFNGKQAMEAVLANQYALVLMDCQMPVMDGYTATVEIRSREPAGRRTVIVALTAHALEGERERVLEAGMDDYLTKPVRPQTLERTLARWIRTEGLGGEVENDTHPVSETSPIDIEQNLQSSATALLQIFLDKVPSQLELLDGALASDDAEEVRVHAHKLKGSLLAVEAHGLAKLAHQLQLDGESRDLSESEGVHKSLLEGFYRLEKRIKQEISERARAAKGVSRG